MKGKGIAFTEIDLQLKTISKIISSDEILYKNVVIDPDIAEVESVKKVTEIRNVELAEEEDDEIPQEVLETLINLKKEEDDMERLKKQADKSPAMVLKTFNKNPEGVSGLGLHGKSE